MSIEIVEKVETYLNWVEQTRNVPDFGQESRKIGREQSNLSMRGRTNKVLNMSVEKVGIVETNRNLAETVKTYQFLVDKVEKHKLSTSIREYTTNALLNH